MIVFVDMDDVLCDYTCRYEAIRRMRPEIKYPQSLIGFFQELDPLPGAVKTVNELRSIYDVYVLTAPSVRNPHSYMEKRIWIEDHFDYEFAKNLIICGNKGLLKGDFLIDDHISGKGQEQFDGELLHFGSVEYLDWKTVREKLIIER